MADQKVIQNEVVGARPNLNNHLIDARLEVQIVVLSVFAVSTHWGVWDKGVFAMGWNTTVVWLGLFYLLLEQNSVVSFRGDWLWLFPLGLIAISFSIYENPWLKLIGIIALPFLVGVFFSFGHTKRKRQLRWTSSFISSLLQRCARVLILTPLSFGVLEQTMSTLFEDRYIALLKRLGRAFVILVPLLCLIIFLLSSADQKFAEQIIIWGEGVLTILDISILFKVICIVIFTVIVLAAYMGLRCIFEIDQASHERKIDGLVAGIILAAVFIIYFVFLSFQLDYLLVDKLPVAFGDAERLVKSGFWQLFFLSGLNVGLFCWAYKATGAFTQWLLRAYLLASILILFSACWRMGLYVYYYGLSYEKFFASYTSLYALLLFAFLAWAVFRVKYQDIVRFVVIS